MTLASERHRMILGMVRSRGTVKLTELADLLKVTPVTVRRDVTALADQGLVVRVHGGITVPYNQPGEPRQAGAPRSVYGTLQAGVQVGMVVPSVEYYWPPVVQGAQSAVAAAGGKLVLRASRYDPEEDRRQAAALLARGVRTLLVAPATGGQGGLDLLRWLGSRTVPVVLVERIPPPELPTLALDAATTAHALGAGLAVRHLAGLGHRSIGMVSARSSPTSRALRSGWRETVQALGLHLDEDLETDVPTYGSADWADAYDRTLAHYRSRGVRALLVHSDREAIGMVERAQDGGIDVPGELAVVTYDDEVAAVSDPALTAVRPQKHRLGATAAHLALARAADPFERPVHRVQLWPTLVVRESCGGTPAPADDGGEGGDGATDGGGDQAGQGAGEGTSPAAPHRS